MSEQSSARLIDGKAYASAVKNTVADAVSSLQTGHGISPGLAVVLVGDDPASAIYVRNKGKACTAVGIAENTIRLPAETSQPELLGHIQRLNDDPSVHGILVQLPLPPQIDAMAVIAAISPEKDVDGFHDVNAGRLSNGGQGLVPCTPQGCMIMLRDVIGDLTGANALVIGRSNIVGKPMALLLLQANCTVTVAHSRTQDLAEVCRGADIVVAAVGRAEMVRGDWLKPGATVIDVGMNRLERSDGKAKLVGDVAFAEAQEIVGAITPVPGGVGPMTIACLLRNTVIAAGRQIGVEGVLSQ